MITKTRTKATSSVQNAQAVATTAPYQKRRSPVARHFIRSIKAVDRAQHEQLMRRDLIAKDGGIAPEIKSRTEHRGQVAPWKKPEAPEINYQRGEHRKNVRQAARRMFVEMQRSQRRQPVEI